jgi:hypothetical protein
VPTGLRDAVFDADSSCAVDVSNADNASDAIGTRFKIVNIGAALHDFYFANKAATGRSRI